MEQTQPIKQQSPITFRPAPQTRAQLAKLVKVTGAHQSKVIREAIEMYSAKLFGTANETEPAPRKPQKKAA